MTRYALIDDTNTVAEMVEWDGITNWSPPEGLTPILDTDDNIGVGWVYANGTFTAPAFVTANTTAISTTISFLQFVNLFTTLEKVAFVESTDPQAKLFVLEAAGSGQLDLANNIVIAGVNYCASIGIIANNRVSQILAGQPPTSN